MKWLIRTFFRTVRLVVTPPMLFLNWITTPKGIARTPDEQKQIDEQTRHLVLYQFKTCPFCIKTRRAMKRLSLNIETRDAQHDPASRQELLEGGGQIKVPCLQITDENGDVTWMYESNDIIAYFERRFAPDAP